MSCLSCQIPLTVVVWRWLSCRSSACMSVSLHRSLPLLTASLMFGSSRLASPCQVSSPHLARSYHHLFPVPQFDEISAAAAAEAAAAATPTPLSTAENGAGNRSAAGLGTGGGTGGRSSPSPSPAPSSYAACAGCLRDLAELPRYQCPECKSAFCLDCDMYVHDSLHNCPGCC